MILDKIVAHKKDEVKKLRQAGLRPPAEQPPAPRGFQKALTAAVEVAIIAEAKKASPSKGIICPDFNILDIARSYRDGGAQAMSILTDETFFQGSLAYLAAARQAVDLPVLRKDFIIDEIQIEQAGLYGADAILLIAAILDRLQIRDFLAMAAALQMDVLVEVHDEKELEMALAAGSRLIGINNRNLRDFTIDLETTFRLKREMPPEMPVVSESGIGSRRDLQRLREAGVNAALIGETLMRAGSTRTAVLKDLLGQG